MGLVIKTPPESVGPLVVLKCPNAEAMVQRLAERHVIASSQARWAAAVVALLQHARRCRARCLKRLERTSRRWRKCNCSQVSFEVVDQSYGVQHGKSWLSSQVTPAITKNILGALLLFLALTSLPGLAQTPQAPPPLRSPEAH